MQDAFQGAFVAVRTGELFPAGDGLIFVQGNAGSLAILKEEEQVATVVAGQTSPQDVLPRLHGQFRGQIFPQQAGLAIRTVGEPQLIALLPVGEHHQLISVLGLPLHEPSVPLFVLLFPRHPQGLRGDLFQIPFLGQEQVDRVIGRFQIQFQIRHILLADDLRQAGLGVPLAHILQLGDDDPLDAGGLGNQICQVVYLLLELVHLLGAFQDVLFVDVPQADVGHILRLNLVNAEADH